MTQNHVKSLLKLSVYLKGTIRRQRVEVGGKHNTDAIIFKLETCGCKTSDFLMQQQDGIRISPRI
jgi:hypothetical protein